MTKDTFRPSVRTTTGSTPLEWPDGQVPSVPARSAAPISGSYIPPGFPVQRRSGEARFWIWEVKAALLHVFGVHTLIPLEIWDEARETIRFEGEACWLCPYRR